MINDDGPGFAPEIMDRIGEPYVTGRRRVHHSVDIEAGGLGLGLFIAKTLLERSGAKLVFANRAPPAQGASVQVRWARADFEERPAPAF
jgi:two-component system sensor histidine kinase RegB